ncbi:hypothetical protein GCM10010210_52220 [Pseudonocardia hydrocarbonoxydans]
MLDPPRRLVGTPGRIAHELELELRPGEPVSVEKVVALVTSRDPAISEPAAAAVELLAEAPGFDELLVGHELALHQLWRRFAMELTDGHGPTTGDTLRVLRLSVFHVLQSVSPHNVDLDAGIPARGLHGEAYRGHVFWDEMFVFPLLTLRLPGLARSLLRYRIRRLDAARRAARAAGHSGAMYPWQSGSDGREETQQMHLNPRSGRWLPDTATCSATSGSRSPTTSGSTTRPPATWSSSPTTAPRRCWRSRASSRAWRPTTRPATGSASAA